jgi:hypothetical protein
MAAIETIAAIIFFNECSKKTTIHYFREPSFKKTDPATDTEYEDHTKSLRQPCNDFRKQRLEARPDS